MASNTAETGPVDGSLDAAQLQQVLGQHIGEQLAKIEEADAAARVVQEGNAKKVQGAIDAALARALMGKQEKAQAGSVKFPQEVFDLAVALTQQPQLLPPVLAFYRRMRDRINQAVSDALKEFGGELEVPPAGQPPAGPSP